MYKPIESAFLHLGRLYEALIIFLIYITLSPCSHHRLIDISNTARDYISALQFAI